MWLLKAIGFVFLDLITLVGGYGLLVLVVELCIEFKQARTVVFTVFVFSALIAMAYFL